VPYTYQKLLKLMEFWQSSDRNNFAQFFLRHRVLQTLVLCLRCWGCCIIYLLMMFRPIFTQTHGLQKLS